jgi:RNA polymerase sigma factor (sigma-70 family)
MAINRAVEDRLWSEARDVLEQMGALYGAVVAQFKEAEKHRGTADDADLWARWHLIRSGLAELYQEAVYAIARSLYARLPRLAITTLEDLASMAQIGLLDALAGFDVTGPIRFTSYCGLRIRGAVLDEIRRMDHVPRRLREAEKRDGTTTHTILFCSEVPDAVEDSREDDEGWFSGREDFVLRNFSTAMQPYARLILLERRTDAGVAQEMRTTLYAAKTMRAKIRARIGELAGLNRVLRG